MLNNTDGLGYQPKGGLKLQNTGNCSGQSKSQLKKFTLLIRLQTYLQKFYANEKAARVFSFQVHFFFLFRAADR